LKGNTRALQKSADQGYNPNRRVGKIHSQNESVNPILPSALIQRAKEISGKNIPYFQMAISDGI